MRVARRRQRRDLLQLRPPQSRALGICAAAPPARDRTSASAVRDRRLGRALPGDADGLPGSTREQPRDRSTSCRLICTALVRFGESGAAARIRGWALVDDLLGGLAPRRPAAHLLQHAAVRQLAPAVADLYGAGRMMIIYTVGGAVGFPFSSAMGWYLPWRAVALAAHSSRPAPRRRFSACLARWFTTDAAPAARWRMREAMRYAVILFVFGLYLPWRGQPRACRRLRWRLAAGMWLDPHDP